MGGIAIMNTMKYYKLNNEVYAFESDGSQEDYITEEMLEMTEEEVDKHIYPEKYYTEEYKYNLYLNSLRPLTRRQFKLALLENNLLATIDTAISNISDPLLKARIEIEYAEATEFVRTSESVKYMLSMLELSEEQANSLWETAQTL